MLHITRRKFFCASIVNGTGFLTATILVLIWFYLLMRFFPSSESGYLLLAIAMAGLVNLLDLGVSLGLTRLISAPPNGDPADAPRTCFMAAIWVTSSMELLLGTSVGVAWIYIEGIPIIAIFGILVFSVSSQVVLLCTSALKGLLDFKNASLISTISTLFSYGSGILVILLLKADVWLILLTMAGLQAICAAAAIGLTLRKLPPAAKSPLLPAYLKLLRESVPLFPQMFTGLFFAHAQRFIIARYAGLDTVTDISFAYSVSTRLHSVMNSFLEIIFPLTRQLQVQGVKLGAFCLRVGLLSALAYILIAGASLIVAAYVTPNITWPLLTYSLGVLFATASAPAYHLLNGSGTALWVSFISLLGPVIFIFIVPLLCYATQVSDRILMPLSYTIALASTSTLIVIYFTGTQIRPPNHPVI